MSSPRCAVRDGYRRGWGLVWALVSATGVLLAMAEWSIPVVVTGLLLDTVLVAVVLSGLRALLGADEKPHVGVLTMVRLSSGGVCGVVAVIAMGDLAPTLGAAVALTALITAPVVLDRMLPWLPSAGTDAGADAGRDPGPQGRIHA
jgi:hypothetical protein